MQVDVSNVTDSVIGANASNTPLVIAATYDSASVNDTTSLLQVPTWVERVSVKTIDAYPPRHDGLLRPVSIVSESFIFASLLCVVFIASRVIKNSARVFPDILRNLLFMDEHSFTQETLSKRSLSFLWPINILIVSLTANVYLQTYGTLKSPDSWLFWKLALYTVLFWGFKQLLYQLVALVFFNAATIRRWKMGNLFILSFFSISLIPLLILHEAGVVIPSYFFYLWPTLFLLIPRLMYSLKGLNFFLLEKGGTFYMILYLCALEILPLLVYLKGIFLIQFKL